MNDQQDRVFYVYSPPWAEWSAGIRVLHLLCHYLNQSSYEAYLVLHGPRSGSDTNNKLKTPVVNRRILKSHLATEKQIVAVYPETIHGNPLRAKFVIRWLLNYPKILGGATKFPEEAVISYSKSIADQYLGLTGEQSAVLFMPSIDLNELKEIKKTPNVPAQYDLIYAQKYKVLGGTLPEFDFPAIEVERFGKKSTSRRATLELIANARIVHIFENTSVATEAAIMGVPVCCHRNADFPSLIAEHELGTVGFSWNHQKKAEPNQQESIAWYEAATSQTNSKIVEVFNELGNTLNPVGVRGKIRLPPRRLITHHSMTRAWNIWKTKGTRVLLRFTKNYLFRGSSKL